LAQPEKHHQKIYSRAMSSKQPDPKFRVKVYELTEDGEWNDKGTGHVQFQLVQVFNYFCAKKKTLFFLEILFIDFRCLDFCGCE
jgi:hypothetical protein